MKKIILLTIAIIAIVILKFTITNNQKELKQLQTEILGTPKSKTILSKTIYTKAITQKVEIKNENISPECTIHFNNIASFSLDELKENIDSDITKIFNGCNKHSDPHLKFLNKLNTDIRKKCNSNNNNPELCMSLIAMYRARIIDFLHKDLPIEEAGSAILMNRLISSFATNLNPSSMEENIKISNELISRVPNLYTAHKAKAISMLLMSIGKKNYPGHENMEATINNCLELNDTDNELFSILAISKKNDPNYKDFLMKHLEQYPKNASANYYLSYYYYRKNDIARAKTKLQIALTNNPANQIFINTMNKLKNYKIGDKSKIYSTILHVNLTDF